MTTHGPQEVRNYLNTLLLFEIIIHVMVYCDVISGATLGMGSFIEYFV